ncbi:hypothetical protein B0O99DRAFT_661481 [Bisporella sp. PMI_857]|nr:hypothetical protein B0O99DRAFT_661481 [Bisporella sp. PMI_857]
MSPVTREQNRGQKDQVEGEENQWKFCPPYKIHGSDTSTSRYEGGCYCGRVQFHIKQAKPLEAKYCHCITCQALRASPIAITTSPGTTRRKLPRKLAGPYCHPSVMNEGDNKILIYPATVKFRNEDERNNFAAQYRMFYKERVIDIKDDLPKWEGMKDKSELVKE